MALIEFEDLPSTNTPINSNGLNNNFSELKDNFDELKPYSLYDNSSGSLISITLSDTAANYRYLEIYFNAENVYKSIKVFNPNGRQIDLCVDNVFATSNYYKNSRWTINNNAITLNAGNEYAVYDSGFSTFVTNSNKVKITKVIGYK